MMCRRLSCSSIPAASVGGFALITALIFLVILTLLGVSIVTSTTSEEKIQRNARDMDIAFAAAEAALRDAELHISGAYKWPYDPVKLNSFTNACTSGLCDSTVTQTFQPVDALDFFGGTAPGSNSRVIGAVTGSPQISGILPANQPRYMIEMMSAHIAGESVTKSGGQKVFRITAQAKGRLPHTRVTLQEVYRTPNIQD